MPQTHKGIIQLFSLFVSRFFGFLKKINDFSGVVVVLSLSVSYLERNWGTRVLYCVQHRLSDVFDGRCQAHRIQTKPVRVRRANNEKLNSRPNCVNKGVRRSREGALPPSGCAGSLLQKVGP